jgi:hypothetical protein
MNILDPIFYRTLFYDFRPVISPGLQLVVAHCIKGIHNGFDQLIDVVWHLLVLKRLDRSEESEIEKESI